MRYIATMLLALVMGSVNAESESLGAFSVSVEKIRVGSQTYGFNTGERAWYVSFNSDPFLDRCSNIYSLDKSIDSQVTLFARAKSAATPIFVAARDLSPDTAKGCVIIWVQD